MINENDKGFNQAIAQVIYNKQTVQVLRSTRP